MGVAMRLYGSFAGKASAGLDVSVFFTSNVNRPLFTSGSNQPLFSSQDNQPLFSSKDD